MANVNYSQTITTDTTAFQDAPTENHGQSGLLAADTRAKVFINFDYPAEYESGEPNRVISATLRIKAQNTVTTGLTISCASTGWGENTLTWNNKPSESAPTVNVSSRTWTAGQFYDIDITAIAKGVTANNPVSFWGIVITGTTVNRLVIWSGENVDGSAPVYSMVYDSPVSSITYPASPMLASATMPGGTKVVDRVVNASPMTATAEAKDALAVFTTNQIANNDIRATNSGFAQSTGDVNAYNFNGGRAMFKFAIPSTIINSNQIVSAFLQVKSTVGAGGSYTISVYEIAGDWFEGSPNPAPELGPLITTFSANDAAKSNADLTAYYKAVVNGTKPNYGVALVAATYDPTTIASRENGTNVGANKPIVAFNYTQAVITNVNPVASVMSATATSVMPVVSVGAGVSIAAAVMSASGDLVNPNVSGSTSVNVSANTATANANMPEAIASVPDREVFAEVMTATATMVDSTAVGGTGVTVVVDGPALATALANDATVSFETEVNIGAAAMTSTGVVLTPVAINGNDIRFYDDPYFVLATQTTDADDIWYRFTETDGATVVKDQTVALINNVNNDGVVVGGASFVQGYGTHRAMVFDGVDDAIIIPEDANKPALQPGSMEFYINTSVKTQPITYGMGYLDVGNGGTPGFIGAGETPRTTTINLVDGKVNLVNAITGPNQPTVTGQMTGQTDVADGNWHQIVITSWWYPDVPDFNSVVNNERVRDYEAGIGGISIYVDGKLDQRKVFNYDQDQFKNVYIAAPDQIGRVGNTYFKGQISEFIHRKFSQINKYYIEELKYAFFQDNPIRAGVMGATASAGNHKAKGNTKRVLALYFRFTDPFFPNTFSYGLDYEWAEGNRDKTTPMFGGFTSTPKTNSTEDIADNMSFLQGSVVNFKNVYQQGTLADPSKLYRDPVTDEPRYINLQTDIDIDDYDALFFVDFPGVQYGPVKKGRNGDQFDKFIESIKKAVFDDGLNLYISQPHVAEYLGIVDGWESKTIARDSRMIPTASIPTSIGQDGMFGGDWKAAYNDVFKNPDARLGIDSAARRAYADEHFDEYFDTHTNSKHRIAALIPGITDLKGYTFDEEIQWADLELSWLLEPQEAYRYTDHPDGLKLGDEFKFNGPLAASSLYEARVAQPFNFRLISYRPDQINVGVAVAKEQLYINDEKLNGNGDKLNPSRENATVIVVQPGSELDGRVINARIVINSNDTVIPASYTASVQDLEDQSWTNAFGWEKETAETRKWTMASNRIPYKMMKVNFTSERIVSRKDGAIAVIAEEHTRDLATYGQQKTIRVDFTDMSERLWNYVLESEPDVGDGGVRINATHMTATAEAINPALGVVANANIVAQSAYGVASMGKVAEDESGDASVFAFASTATAAMAQPGKNILAGAMTANGIMIDPVGISFDTEDIIYLTLATPGTVVLTRNGDSV